jgi:hypothetical protein
VLRELRAERVTVLSVTGVRTSSAESHVPRQPHSLRVGLVHVPVANHVGMYDD